MTRGSTTFVGKEDEWDSNRRRVRSAVEHVAMLKPALDKQQCGARRFSVLVARVMCVMRTMGTSTAETDFFF